MASLAETHAVRQTISRRDPDSLGATSGLARSTPRTVQSLVTQLEEDIVLGFLHPRERLIEDALIERFGVKRYAVREVLTQLERLGLVERLPNRGAMVKALTPAEVEDIYAVREILETAAAREAVRRVTPESIESLIQVQHRHDAATSDGDPRAAFRANIEFHRALFSNCGNAQLVGAIEQFGQKAHCIRSFSISDPAYLKRACDEHWTIIEALQERDTGKLIDICREHIRFAKDGYIASYRRRFPDHLAPGSGAKALGRNAHNDRNY